MPKFRKKPVVIEAVQLTDDYDDILCAVEFVFNVGMETSLIGMIATVDRVRQDKGFHIQTLEGDMFASIGDWVIKGINGEFYPCKPDIFAKTYEPIKD